ncbi:MAG: (Fe-S)-binding protein [Phycisphaerales bacterium]|nr:MAG: (Fe-S)-binding protein [Phycisphaerales bacterium]
MSERDTDGARIAEKACETLAGSIRGLAAYHLNACVRCGLCAETCHVYQGEPVPENHPGAKVAKVAGYYRKYHTLLGKYAPRFVGAKDLTLQLLDELIETVYGRCTACGRCGIHCSVGLDVAAVIQTGRNVLAAVGKVPEGLQRTVDNQIETGNQMAVPPEELLSTAEWLADDLKVEMGDDDASVYVNQKGKRALYLVNPREVKFFPLSLMAAAGVFHAAGESWTISSKVYDVTNYGFFSGDAQSAAELTRRVVEEAKALAVEEIILSECGHGYRSFRWEGPNWVREEYPVRVRSVLELLDEYIVTGRIKVDPTKNDERVTLHDPCNLVRHGGLSEPQRRVLRAVTRDFVEMTPNRQDNFCCGGGGGMLSMSEYGDRRIASGRVKADQIRATGAKIVATPCHNCADQLLELSKRYDLGVEIRAVVELVYSSLC